MSRIALGVLALAWLALVGWTASVNGLIYLPFWIAAAAPGVPLGLRVFGRHAAGWVAGAAAGYALTCLTVWVVVAAELACPTGFAIAWVVESVVIAFVARQIRTPIVPLRPWTPRDTAALCAVLLLVPGLMAAPYRNIGAADAEGRTYYRAYFTADFVWHVALTAELGRFTMPPRNPYMADRDLHYYWTYFLVPAAVTGSVPGLDDVEAALKVNAECTAMLLLASIFLFARTAGATALATALGVVLVVLASSAEGFAAIVDLLSARTAAVGASRGQHRCDYRVVVQRPADRWRAPHDVLQPAAQPLGHAGTARAPRRRGSRDRAPRAGRRLRPASCSASPRRSTHSSGPPSRRFTGSPCSVTRS